MHRLLGIAAYFANRMPYSAIIAHPLRQMLKQKTIKEFSEEQLEALRRLKESIITNYLSQFNSKFINNLIVDAGPKGIGVF